MVRSETSLYFLCIFSLILVEESDYISTVSVPFFQHFQIPIEKKKSSRKWSRGTRDRLKRERHYSRSRRKDFIRKRIRRFGSATSRILKPQFRGVGMNEGVNTKEAKGFVIHWQATRRSRRSFPPLHSLLFSSTPIHPSGLTSSGYIERCFLKPNPVSSVVDASMLIRYNVQASIETAASSVHYGVPRTMASRATMIYVARPVSVLVRSRGPR